MARYIVFGAGSVGGLIGGRLHLAGQEVVLIARGAHRDTMMQSGLRLKATASDDLVKVQVVGAVRDIAIRPEDRIVLAMKTQEAAQALQELRQVAPAGIAVICAQNGLESERLSLRLFEHVYGAYVYVLAALSEPGTVGCYTFPGWGVIDIGSYPDGPDPRADAMAAEFRAAGFDSIARPDIMKWKRGKLLLNTSNPIGAACSAPHELQDIASAARREAEACFRAAGTEFVSMDDVKERAAGVQHRTIAGRAFPGGSTAQGLARGADTSEVDFLNGEVVLLGRTYRVPTPVNESLQDMMRELIRARIAPGSMSPDEFRRRISRL